MKELKTQIKISRAQTAAELAIFGAILIFVLGLIIRQTANAGLQQNQSLRAMRLAMKTSLEYSEGRQVASEDPWTRSSSSRNIASILLIEDRLAVTSGRQAAVDRVPYIAGGSGAHTKNLFMPLDANEVWNLPVSDMFINGQHFIFRVAGFKILELATPAGDEGPDAFQWDPNCAKRESYTAGDPPVTVPEEFFGCAILYSQVANSQASKKWCIADCPGPPVPCCVIDLTDKDANLPVDARFDLDRDFAVDPFIPDPDVTNDGIFPDYPDFMWQWYMVKAFNEGFGQFSGSFEDPIPPVEVQPPGGAINFDKGKNLLVDVDGDLQEERIIKIEKTLSTGVIAKIHVADFQEGDLDFSWDEGDPPPRPGLESDVQMFTFTKEGNYLLLDQGQLFFPSTNQYVRSVQKKDQIDLVQRIINLSHDTKRFCDAAGNPPDFVDGLPNPVEVCCAATCNNGASNCFDSLAIEKTCMDIINKIIFVRSRIKDLHGRKWITDTTSDDYIDIKSSF